MNIHDSLENVKLILIIIILAVVLFFIITSWSSVINFINRPIADNVPSDNGISDFIKQVNDFFKQFFKR